MRTNSLLIPLVLVLLVMVACDSKTKTVDSCGDGFVDPGEDCDGSALNGASCASLGFYKAEGVLACNAECRYDTTDCDTARCGDTILQSDREDCEGDNLGGETCVSLGYERGTLACNSTCSFDRSDCEGAGSCGDGIIQAPEECDRNQLDGQTCASLGYYSGTLTCADDCQFELGSCQHRCGDGVVDDAHQEVCDGTNLNSQTCAGLGYYGGTLACAEDCRDFDEMGCAAVGRCGDGEIQSAHSEVCDGAELGGETCVSQGYSQGSGALGCTTGCLFDEGMCVPKSTNADLATLTVSSGTLTPAFSAAEINYTVTVPNVQETLTVTATAADPWATVAIAPVQPMTLAEGANAVTVTVTAENGTQKTYTVTVTRLRNYVSPNIGTLIYVPAGTFQRDGTPTNLSTVSAFRMSQYEITRAQWVAVTGWADPSDAYYSSGTNDPVQNVSWYHAIAFCNKLSLLEGLTPVYTVSGVDFATLTYAQIPMSDNSTWNAATANWAANGYRLPTDMEWMWAAMGADTENPGAVNTTGYAKAFAGSTGTNALEDYAWYAINSGGKSHQVGARLANELGFFDFSGNILEWVWDWNLAHPSGTLTDYRGGASGSSRAHNGGSWYGPELQCAIVGFTGYVPSSFGRYLGFRVARR